MSTQLGTKAPGTLDSEFLEEASKELEQHIIGSIVQLRDQQYMWRQKIYKSDEIIAYYKKELDKLQRARITAANAQIKTKPQPVSVPMLEKLKKETGLTTKEIDKALDLMKKASKANDSHRR